MLRLLATGLIWGGLLSGAGGPAGAADGFDIQKIRAHLFQERSGTLSEDILQTKPVLWNTIIGEGDVAEPASDVLIVVELRSRKDAVSETPLVIEVTYERDGKVIRKSRQFDYFYAELGEYRVARAFWLQDVTCDPLSIVVTHGPDRREAEVPFHCGE